MHTALLLKSVPVDGKDENDIGSLSSLPGKRGKFAPATAQEALTEEQTISPLCPRLPSDPRLHPVSVPTVCPGGMAQYAVLYLRHVAGFQKKRLT